MKRSFIGQFLIAFAVMAVTAFILLKSLDLYSRHGSAIVVPHVVDLRAEEAIDRLDDENLEAVITDSLYQEGKKPGVVLEQNPTGGEEVKKGRKVYLLVSTGNPPMVEVPELRDLSMREANALLETKGLKLGKVTKKPGPGAVLDMMYKGKSIPAKTKIQKGMSVDVVIGTGMGGEKVPVPDLTGMTRTEAINLLTSMGLGLGFEKYENVRDTARARITRQYPTATDEPSINQGNVIDLWYGQ
jgi:beta-lactam-binding protein with PASTA domain